MNNHKTMRDDSEYDVTIHPGFASECTVTTASSNGSRTLYKQTETYNCGDEGHPTTHQVVVVEKSGEQRTVTITIDDPKHAVHSIALDLYEPGRDPKVKKEWKTKDRITVLNTADTCPPNCIG
ncbi:MAG TPA: hypothetical protein VF006_02270 [Longimicrobium sp.]